MSDEIPASQPSMNREQNIPEQRMSAFDSQARTFLQNAIRQSVPSVGDIFTYRPPHAGSTTWMAEIALALSTPEGTIGVDSIKLSDFPLPSVVDLSLSHLSENDMQLVKQGERGIIEFEKRIQANVEQGNPNAFQISWEIGNDNPRRSLSEEKLDKGEHLLSLAKQALQTDGAVQVVDKTLILDGFRREPIT